MKKTLKNSGARVKKTDYFAIVRNAPPDQQPKSEPASSLLKKVEKLRAKKNKPSA